MKLINFLFFLLLIINLASCSKKEEKVSLIKEKNLEMQMIEAYNEGLKEFETCLCILILGKLMQASSMFILIFRLSSKKVVLYLLFA